MLRGFFDSGANTAKTIQKLIELVKQETICHEGNDDPRWAEIQVKALAKNIKKAKQLEELEKAIVFEERLTDCCVVPRDHDGKKRLPKHERPHVMYMKMWRYPWLRSLHELRPVENCRHPYHKKAEWVCVNPWHYEALHKPPPTIAPVVIDRRRIVYPQGFQENRKQALTQLHIDTLKVYDRPGVPNVTVDWDDMRGGFASGNISPMSGDHVGSPTTSEPGPSSLRSLSPQSYLSEDLETQRQNDFMDVDEDEHKERFVVPRHTVVKFVTTIPEDPLRIRRRQEVKFVTTIPEDPLRIRSHGGVVPSSVTVQCRSHEGNGQQQEVTMDDDMVVVHYVEQKEWMSVGYYEMDVHMGDMFEAVTPYVLIDGYTAPNEIDRFSLGYQTCNARNATNETRRQIGRGVRFYYTGGEVFVETVSDCPVFVQSPNCNQRHGWHPSTVCKVPPRCNLKIFNNAEFAAHLRDCVEKGSFEGAYALTRLCMIRMSFVKGWGRDYKRQMVTSTPCWIEIHLNGPLQWVDRVLTSMGDPAKVASSFT